MSWTRSFPNTFVDQVTSQVTHNHEEELKTIYALLSQLFANHAHTGTGSDGAPIAYATEAGTAEETTGNSATATLAAKATVLEIARKIAGIPFNGSEDIDIPYANLTGKPTIPSANAYDSAHLFAENGHQKFSNGLILQWGRANDVALNTNVTIPFSIPFPNACLIVVPNSTSTGGNPTYNCNTISYSTTSWVVNVAAGGGGSQDVLYIAIGF